MKKAQTLGLAIIIAVFVFLIGMMMINFLKPEITRFRTNLSCSDANTISDGTKLLCLATGTLVPYWILLILSVTIGGVISQLRL